MKEEQKIKHFSTEVKLNTIFTILKNTNYRNVFDFSTDVKVRKFLDRFMNESCNIKYSKIKEEYRDAQQTYKLYTAENLLNFIASPEVINFILSSEKFKNIKVSFSKKFTKSLDNDAWKNIAYIPIIDEEKELLKKLDKEYKNFNKFNNFYKIRKFNPDATYKLEFTSIVIYDVTDKKNIKKVWEYPLESDYKDNATYINMCKIHWCKQNEFSVFEKFKDARVSVTSKYNELLNS